MGSRMTKVTIAVAVLATLVASTNAFTLATFADPTLGPATPLFTLAGTTFTGGWGSPGLTLQVPATTSSYSNATFTMTPLPLLNPGGLLGGGTISFFDSASNPLF
jgi:hypothetical protein